MLIKELYIIDSFTYEESRITASITLNKDHEVFEGHFPGNPVMPGVCMMQIIKELTEKAVGSKLFMSRSSNIKFMAKINPYSTPELLVTIAVTPEENTYKIKSNVVFGETIALKLNALYNHTS